MTRLQELDELIRNKWRGHDPSPLEFSDFEEAMRLAYLLGERHADEHKGGVRY